ncbi:MAG TPA: ATP-dependent helicase [Candidatus Saccharimonadales bacterium]|nr:ATP-dependent helicase [Candidatus Saccharimonadales bacterium]
MSTELNHQQRAAVEAGDGPVLIVAGPGTGKTKTLTARIAHLLRSGVKAGDILALTFTVKSAREMHERVAALLDGGNAPDISTFHSLGHHLLKDLEPGTELKFVDEATRQTIIRELPRPAEMKSLTVRELALAISKQKGALGDKTNAAGQKILDSYQAALGSAGLIDYDDLLYRVYHELPANSGVHNKWRRRYRYILIDEFQDTSELQWALIGLIRGNDNVFVIGDPKQSIYGFRGASAEMFDRFRGDFTGYTEVTLDVNYRSDASIVALASTIFDGRDALTAHSTQPGTVKAVRTLNEFSEADYILAQIEEGIGGSDLLKANGDGGGRFRDFAVLYRTHQVSKTLQRRLHDSGIPFQVVGEGSPYEQPDVQAIVGIFSWLSGGELPKVKGFSGGQLQALLEGLDATEAVSKLAGQVIDKLGLAAKDDGRQRLNQFVSTLVRFDGQEDGLRAAVDYIEKLSQEDFYDPEADMVTLMTIHASKGLEFSHVFVIAAEEGTLPNIRKTIPTDFDEEKRLFYVAVTRARNKLDILYAGKRGGEVRELSRFVQDIDEGVLPRADDPAMAALKKKLHKREQKARQATLF